MSIKNALRQSIHLLLVFSCLILSVKAYATDCSIVKDPQKISYYLENFGAVAYANLLKECAESDQLDVETTKQSIQDFQRQKLETTTSNSQNSFNREKRRINNPTDQNGRACVTLNLDHFKKLEQRGVEHNWVLYANAKNICDKPLTVVVTENGRTCKTERIGAGATLSIGCWTYGKENIEFRSVYDPYW